MLAFSCAFCSPDNPTFAPRSTVARSDLVKIPIRTLQLLFFLPIVSIESSHDWRQIVWSPSTKGYSIWKYGTKLRYIRSLQRVYGQIQGDEIVVARPLSPLAKIFVSNSLVRLEPLKTFFSTAVPTVYNFARSRAAHASHDTRAVTVRSLRAAGRHRIRNPYFTRISYPCKLNSISFEPELWNLISTNQNTGNYHLFKKYVLQSPDSTQHRHRFAFVEEQTNDKTSTICERQQDTLQPESSPCNQDKSILPTPVIDPTHVSIIKIHTMKFVLGSSLLSLLLASNDAFAPKSMTRQVFGFRSKLAFFSSFCHRAAGGCRKP